MNKFNTDDFDYILPKKFIAQNSAGTQLFAATQLSGFSKNPEFSVPWKVHFLGT